MVAARTIGQPMPAARAEEGRDGSTEGQGGRGDGSGGAATVPPASLAGLIAFDPDPIYTLTKHAVVGLVRSLAPQLMAKGITVNAVCPGITDTPLVGDEAKRLLQEAQFPLIEPRQIAAAVLACMTGSMTGEAFVCQAGREPVPYRFPRVPGPRLAGAEGHLPPAGMAGAGPAGGGGPNGASPSGPNPPY